MRLPYSEQHKAIGALVGQAVADALGGPFEFGRPGDLTRTFRGGPVEMIGGGSFGWEPAEFTDDTQMAVLLGEILVGGWDPEAMFQRWKGWATTAKDIGSTTRRPLTATSLGDAMASRVPGGRGNGCVMRVSPVGIVGSQMGPLWTESVAREQAEITHMDPRTVEASVILAVTISLLVKGTEFNAALRVAIDNHCKVEMRIYFTNLLLEGTPLSEETNGFGDICLAEAVRAVRSTDSFEAAICRAVDGGYDADTVGAVTGALAGAIYGMQEIPARLATHVHGYIGGVKYTLEDLQRLASTLVEHHWRDRSPT